MEDINQVTRTGISDVELPGAAAAELAARGLRAQAGVPVPLWGTLVIVSGGKGLGGEPLIGPGHPQPSGKELSGPHGNQRPRSLSALSLRRPPKEGQESHTSLVVLF